MSSKYTAVHGDRQPALTEQTDSQVLAEAHAVMETAVDAIITISDHGIIENFNQAAERLFGYNRAEVVGQNVNRLMPAPHAGAHDEYLARYLTSRVPSIIGKGRQLEARHRDGHLIPIHLAVSEYLIDGETHFTGIVRDLSEIEQANEQIRAQGERLAHAGRLSLMGEMTAAIAHEINQPLTAISMYAEAALFMSEQQDINLKKLREAITKLGDQSLRAGAVIERIQRFVRGTSGERRLTDLNELIRESVSLARNDARLHGVEIVTNYDPEIPGVLADPIEIQQVALNLIRNGMDSMSEVGNRYGNSLRVNTTSLRDRVRVEVCDSGTGVAEGSSELLFTPFHTTKADGMGMGLSICNSIITGHGGHLSFDNNVDHGATFFFELPSAGDDV